MYYSHIEEAIHGIESERQIHGNIFLRSSAVHPDRSSTEEVTSIASSVRPHFWCGLCLLTFYFLILQLSVPSLKPMKTVRVRVYQDNINLLPWNLAIQFFMYTSLLHFVLLIIYVTNNFTYVNCIKTLQLRAIKMYHNSIYCRRCTHVHKI